MGTESKPRTSISDGDEALVASSFTTRTEMPSASSSRAFNGVTILGCLWKRAIDATSALQVEYLMLHPQAEHVVVVMSTFSTLPIVCIFKVRVSLVK